MHSNLKNENIKAGLYIHVPFCLSKCAYCSFYSIKSIGLIPAYLSALEQEIKFYSKYFSAFDTVYIGGGTPSLLSCGQLANILSAIHKYYKIDANTETTLEANPGDISIEYLKNLRHLGINRLNIGIQSFNDRILRFLGRRHTAKQAMKSILDARQAGFDNLGIDLIYGVYGCGIKSWENALHKAVSLTPEHISCYQLSLDSRTPLYKHYTERGLKLPVEKEELKFFLATAEFLEGAGYIHYEVSNYARNTNLQSQHNSKYWQHVPYLGLGPGAHSFLNNKRWWNKSSVRHYLQEIAGGKMPVEGSEELTKEQLQLETLFLGLRTKAGINLETYQKTYGTDLLLEKKTIFQKLLENKLVTLEDNILAPTRNGMAVADSLALI